MKKPWQFFPIQPILQVQEYDDPSDEQVAPFSQGDGTHGSAPVEGKFFFNVINIFLIKKGEKKKNDINAFRH